MTETREWFGCRSFAPGGLRVVGLFPQTPLQRNVIEDAKR